jgi:hypothetical protein
MKEKKVECAWIPDVGRAENTCTCIENPVIVDME